MTLGTAQVIRAHALDNRGVAFDAVGCSCGWCAKATSKAAKREALAAHISAALGIGDAS